MEIKDRDFKIGLLKEFWNRRNQGLVPASSEGMGIKKQKFLVFYNLLAQSLSKPFTLDGVKAFEQGPVYYDIYAYVSKTGRFLEQEKIEKQTYSEDILNATLKLVESESHESLSEITHSFDLWKNKYDENYDEDIIKDNFQYDKNNIYEEDISTKDNMVLKVLYDYYLNIYNNYDLVKIYGKIYAVERRNIEKIREIIEREPPYIKEVLDEISEIDTTAKINYKPNYAEEGMEGILIDI